MEYTVKKVKFKKKKVCKIMVFFDNGDYITIDGSEIVDISINTYDRLVRHGNGFVAVAQSGCIELAVNEQFQPQGGDFLYNMSECVDNRKPYVEDRFVREGGISEIWLFDKLNWHHEVLGNFVAQKDGDILRLTVVPQLSMGEYSSDMHKITLGDITALEIANINLDFENCEDFSVYYDELRDVKLEFSKTLEWGSSKFYRRLKSGYIKLKIGKRVRSRAYNLFDDEDIRRKDFENRLCGRGGFSAHDICHLYITLNALGHSIRERIEIDDMKPNKEIDKLIKREDYDGGNYYYFESGYANMMENRVIVLTFGKNAYELIMDV